MKLPEAGWQEKRLSRYCSHAAAICCSKEFKKLHREMARLYRKSGVRDASRKAFQDSLFSMMLERFSADEWKEDFHYV